MSDDLDRYIAAQMCDPEFADAFAVAQHRAPELSETEAARVAAFDAAPAAPESYVQQHRSEPSCFCNPRQVGTLGIWDHNIEAGA